MPALRKLSKEEIQRMESSYTIYAPIRMTPKMYKVCKEYNTARYTAHMEGSK